MKTKSKNTDARYTTFEDQPTAVLCIPVLPDGIRITSSCSLSLVGGFVHFAVLPPALTTGYPIPGPGFEEDDQDETAQILRDERTMALLREAEEDMRSGRMIDGDELRKRP